MSRITPAEEAYLRHAIAERERALADELLRPDGRDTREDLAARRQAIERLRAELKRGES